MIDYLPLVLTGLGLTASIIYYTRVLENSNKTQKLQLETRKSQHYMQLLQMVSNEEFLSQAYHLQKLDIKTYEDYLEFMSSGSEDYMKFRSYIIWTNGLGHMLREGLIDRDMIASFGQGIQYIRAWQKWGPFFLRQRETGNAPDIMAGFEFLVDAMKDRRRELGLSTEFSEELGAFIIEDI